MRLAVIVPAYNEQESVTDVIKRIPSDLPGIDSVHVFVVDDGSDDDTATRAKAAGATVLSHPQRRGLAAAFRTGIYAALSDKSDLLATLDADGQYRPEDIRLLVDRMCSAGADIVIGDRQVERRTHMRMGNRIGNLVGSWMLRRLASVNVRDASSGLRLFTAHAARQLRITSEHTYTHEMLIQASAARLMTTDAPVEFLPRAHGQSKLVRTLRHHIVRSCGTILRSLFVCRPLRNFLVLAGLTLLAMTVLGFSFALSPPTRFGPYVLLVALGAIAFQFVLLGLLAESHVSQRRIDADPPRVT